MKILAYGRRWLLLNMGSRATGELNVTDHLMGVGPWKHITSLWEEFPPHITFDIGNGQHSRSGRTNG